jgi:hypothetical protein
MMRKKENFLIPRDTTYFFGFTKEAPKARVGKKRRLSRTRCLRSVKASDMKKGPLLTYQVEGG